MTTMSLTDTWERPRSTYLLTYLLTHGGVAQNIRDNEIIELIYEQLPNHMKSDLEQMNNFDINNIDMTWFHEVLEHLKLSYQLEKKMEKSKKSKTSKKDSEKPNDKHSGKKCANATNKSSPVSAKKLCLAASS